MSHGYIPTISGVNLQEVDGLNYAQAALPGISNLAAALQNGNCDAIIRDYVLQFSASTERLISVAQFHLSRLTNLYFWVPRPSASAWCNIRVPFLDSILSRREAVFFLSAA
jgi:hypothetical protein